MQALLTKFLTSLSMKLLEYLAKTIIIPLAQYLYMRGILVYDKKKGELSFKKLKKAKEEHNETDYNNTIDNV